MLKLFSLKLILQYKSMENIVVVFVVIVNQMIFVLSRNLYNN